MKKLILFLILVTAVVIAGETITIERFNGELSPFVGARYDLPEYKGGLRDLTNMVAESQGGVVKRPGTYYISDANVVTAVRLIPFEYSTTESYVVEVGKEYMRFYLEE